ncbi:response regulator transcription factor [Paenibacillus cellulositrophicus]|uniref:response regulator transcription factor n=1 Tax=Paenibacillus cellulositrophicus TaxID=562959 RepID=UPI00203C9F06|nr:response regulator transcription factor [Paenibacillus cellulositrophicus]MCM2999082.1 response regulator transcription factor [Paenibacillus cellulositrophicus]
MHESILALGLARDSEVVDALLEERFELYIAGDEEEAAQYARSHPVDLLLMDLTDSVVPLTRLIRTVLREQKGRRFPTVVLTPSDMDQPVSKLFRAGANDVLKKPTDTDELLARIRNLLSLFGLIEEQYGQTVTIADLDIDPKSRTVTRGGIPIELTAKEYDLLLYLARHVNQVCSREDILKYVWEFEFHMVTNVVDVYIRHLRKKVDRGFKKKLIHTVRGVGYIIKEGQ